MIKGRHCKMMKEDGEQCGGMAITGSDYCFMHAEETKEEAQEARIRGGQQTYRRIKQLSPIQISKIEDIVNLMEETINLVREQGAEVTQFARVMAQCSKVVIDAITQGEIEQRLMRVEQKLDEQGKRDEYRIPATLQGAYK